MDIIKIREYCINKPDVEECFPFDEETLVFKTGGKIFALMSLDGEQAINLKCEPELALELRDRYSAVSPGYHMNKKHWNTVLIDGSVPDSELLSWIDHSYSLVAPKH
jgi:predicted DNA-binding protein (MmcQ/YjbR family)